MLDPQAVQSNNDRPVLKILLRRTGRSLGLAVDEVDDDTITLDQLAERYPQHGVEMLTILRDMLEEEEEISIGALVTTPPRKGLFRGAVRFDSMLLK